MRMARSWPYARRLDPLSPAFGNPWQVFTYSVASGAETLVSADGTENLEQGTAATADECGWTRSRLPKLRGEPGCGDSNGFQDVFSFDRTGSPQPAVPGSGGVPGEPRGFQGEVSGDGRGWAFTGFASNLVPAVPMDWEMSSDRRFFGPFVDADGDGLPDFWGTGPLRSLAETANGDPDGDGMNNAAEYAARTMPTDPTSQWKVVAAGILAHAGLDGAVTPGWRIRQWRETLGGAGGWTPVGDLNPGYRRDHARGAAGERLRRIRVVAE